MTTSMRAPPHRSPTQTDTKASLPESDLREEGVEQVLIKDRTAIAGIGQTEFAKSLDRSEKRLALEAIKLALDDAGIEPGEVDGLSSYTLETTEEAEIARNLGLGDITFFSQVGYGGGAGAAWSATPPWPSPPASATSPSRGAAASAARRRAGRGRRSAPRVRGQHQWTRPFGLLRPVDEIAVAGPSLLPRVRRHPRTTRIRRGCGPPSRQPQPRGDDAREDR